MPLGRSRVVPLDPDIDLAAAWQAHVERHVVGDAERQELRIVAVDDAVGDLDDGALDAAAGHHAGDLALVVDRHLRARWAGRRAADPDHGGECDLVASRYPAIDVVDYVLHRVAPFQESLTGAPRRYAPAPPIRTPYPGV